MANEGNLKPIRTKSEAREKGKKGGKKSGEVRAQRKTLREELIALLETKIEDKTIIPYIFFNDGNIFFTTYTIGIWIFFISPLILVKTKNKKIDNIKIINVEIIETYLNSFLLFKYLLIAINAGINKMLL